MMAGLPCLSLLSAETPKLLRPCYSMVQRLIVKSLKADGNWFALSGGSENKSSSHFKSPIQAVARVSSSAMVNGFNFSYLGDLRTPLMFAASLGDCQLVKLLLKYNASVNTFACPHDWNPLCAAIQANNKDIVRVLLDASRQKESGTF